MANTTQVDASIPDSAGWWLEHLGKKLAWEIPRFDHLDAYFRGTPPLPEGADNARSAYQKFQRKARTNFAEMVCEAPRQRMRPVGFRTGAAGDDNGDRKAREIWNANDLDVGSADVHRTMLSLSRAYAIVGLDDETGDALITDEDPRQVITQHYPALPRRVLAGLKILRDQPSNTDYAYLYLRGKTVSDRCQVWKAARPVRRTQRLVGSMFRASDWEWDDYSELTIRECPVVRFENARSQGEYEQHLDLLDRINHMVLQRLVIATMQAFRQRAVQGDLPEVDAAGNKIDYNQLFVADPGAMWTLPEGVSIWESTQVDLAGILESVRDDIINLGAVTFTPLHYLLPESSRSGGSAEGAQLTREGLVFKTEDRIARANIGWRQVMSLAFRLTGDEQRADLKALEPIWAPAERLTLSERADAASKATDVPWRTKMTELWGFDPEIVDRAEGERGADAFFQLALMAAQQPGQIPGQPARPVAGAPSSEGAQ